MLKTLLVDDDRTSLLLLTRVLAEYADCTSCESGSQAVQAIRDSLLAGTPFQLMLIDIGLGDMDGRVLLKKVREIETKMTVSHDERCRIIMVTATRDLDTRRECESLKSDGYVVKPLNNVVIRTRLKKLGLLD